MMNLQEIQTALNEADIDGWLCYDFHNQDHLSYRVLGLDFGNFTSRRWFYYIPANGEPTRLTHTVEPRKLDSLPGSQRYYLAYGQLHKELENILGSPKKVAMQYSPLNNIPYISMADAGTVELVRSFGHTIVSSADLVQLFESRIDEKGFQSHIDAGKIVLEIKDQAYAEIGRAIRESLSLTEYEIQQFIANKFDENGLTDDGHHPIVGVNDHPCNPHFEPTKENSYNFKKGDCVLIDLWAKKKEPGSIYFDVTWCGFIGEDPPAKYLEIFDVVSRARDAAVSFVKDKFAKGDDCYGWQVDDVCRNVIKDAGYGQYFIHRTGHSIGEEVHGNGVNIDNLETKDERKLIPGICFSIEPGIYLKEMAVRSEINVFITMDGDVVIEGEPQKELILVR